MKIPLIIFSAAAVIMAGCGGGVAGGTGISALESCDYGQTCAEALKKAASLPDLSPEYRARILHIKMNSLMRLPEPDRSFIESTGMQADMGYLALAPDLDAVNAAAEMKSEAAAASQVAAFMREPTCARFLELESIQKGGGMFADSAAMARISSLVQLLTAVTPENSPVVASAIRMMVGCTHSDRTEPAAVMLSARLLLEEIVQTCPSDQSGDRVYRQVCDQAASILKGLTLPLPLADARSGEIAGALLPGGRQIGVAIDPPWMLTLSAGRLAVVDQAVLAADARQIPENQPSLLIDLRQTHRPEDIRTGLHQAMKSREFWKRQGDERTKFAFIAVDRSTTFSDLAEVMDAWLAETDALPLVAVLPEGTTRPVWRPMNFFISTRPLFSSDGALGSWNREPGQPSFELSPFTFVSKTGTAEIVRGGKGMNAGAFDLRQVGRMAAAAIENGKPRAASLKVSPAVTVDLLMAVTEVLSYRFPESAFESAAAFASSQEIRKGVGGFDYLLPWVVIERPAR